MKSGDGREVTLMLLALLLAALPAQADIYKYVDKHGRVILTDTPTHTGYKRLVKTWKGWEESKSQIALKDLDKNRSRFTSTIRQFADRYQLPTHCCTRSSPRNRPMTRRQCLAPAPWA